MMGKIAVIFILIFPFGYATCQETKLSDRIFAIAEELAADESDPTAAELFTEWLFELTQDPVIINSGDETEISRLFFLTDFQVSVLADYVKTTGKIVSVFEIANIPGFDRENTEMLIPFITLENRNSAFSDSVHIRQTLLTNLIYKKSLADTSILGSAWKNLIKYKFIAGRFAFGFTAEKDPGERFLSGKIPLPDFLSGYLLYNGKNIIKRVILGDYSARFGQGTNTNTGIRTGLSLTTSGYLSGRNEIRPYTSTDENNFFRGSAAELSYRNFDISLFLSMKKIDATLNDTVNSTGSIKTFYKTGLHNTTSSLLKKDAAGETGFGINISYNINNLRTGIIITRTMFSLPVVPDFTGSNNLYEFSGRTNNLYSIYYNSLIKRFMLYGEFSYSGLKKYAFVQGVSFKPAARLNINILYRNYSPGFISFHGNGPSGSSVNSNEYGILANFTFEVARFLFLSAGTDMRKYPWLRYRCSAPSIAKRHEIRLKYFPSKKLVFEAFYNYRFSLVDKGIENRIPDQSEISAQTVKISARYSPTENITLISRADYKIVKPAGSTGMLLLQDVNFKFRRIPVSIWMRYCIYNTGGFESGLYTWENDILNSFSVPVLYGKGSRIYLMASWKIGDRAELRIKYGITSSYVINSRMKEINEIKFQLRITI
jgi:hypothetical protein